MKLRSESHNLCVSSFIHYFAVVFNYLPSPEQKVKLQNWGTTRDIYIYIYIDIDIDIDIYIYRERVCVWVCVCVGGWRSSLIVLCYIYSSLYFKPLKSFRNSPKSLFSRLKCQQRPGPRQLNLCRFQAKYSKGQVEAQWPLTSGYWPSPVDQQVAAIRPDHRGVRCLLGRSNSSICTAGSWLGSGGKKSVHHLCLFSPPQHRQILTAL